MAFTRSLGSPSFVVKVLNFLLLSRLRPPASVPIQMLPSRSSKSERTRLLDRPSFDVNVSTLPFSERATPPDVAIHSAPSRSIRKALTLGLGSATTTGVAPSFSIPNSPSSVPNQRQPFFD